MDEGATIAVDGFQSTHPMRGATELAFNKMLTPAISIHAPHEGCDLVLTLALCP